AVGQPVEGAGRQVGAPPPALTPAVHEEPPPRALDALTRPSAVQHPHERAPAGREREVGADARLGAPAPLLRFLRPVDDPAHELGGVIEAWPRPPAVRR